MVTNIKPKAFAELVQYSLLSYYYIKDDLQYYIDKGQNVFLDCGAFSFQTRGGQIVDIEDYAAFCHKFGDKVDCYANMDVIGDGEKTFENQQILEDFGLNPIPVFHRGTSMDYLVNYLKGDYDYIALGGVADPRERVESAKWMSKVVSLISEHNPTIKTHAFGVTSKNELVKYRFYSCDSSTWCDAMRYNKWQRYLGNGGLTEIAAEKTKDFCGFHFGDRPLDTKIRQSLTAWLHVVDWCKRITPSSEEPFRKSEIEALTVP